MVSDLRCRMKILSKKLVERTTMAIHDRNHTRYLEIFSGYVEDNQLIDTEEFNVVDITSSESVDNATHCIFYVNTAEDNSEFFTAYKAYVNIPAEDLIALEDIWFNYDC